MTKNIREEDLERIRELTKGTADEMRAAGFPISDSIEKITVNGRTKKRLGACRREIRAGGVYSFAIEISARVLMCSDAHIKNIIAHELLHTCPGAFDHGKKWKEYGALAQRRLGYFISRTMDPKDMGLEDERGEQIRYVVVCKTCGRRFERKRMCPLVKNPKRYRCGKCGGRLELL